MKIAITGGTGLVGGHLAHSLQVNGHDLVLLARGTRTKAASIPGPRMVIAKTDLSDPKALAAALAGCECVVHCAGINREIGQQTYQRVHVEGTRNLAAAAKAAGVRKILMMSFLRARPNCGSAYHESKWAAEEIVRQSGLDYTIFKSGMVYGQGDHMLDHLSHSLHTIPLFASVGLKEKAIRPVAIDDLIHVMREAISDP
ncbi:MAG TPA: NAD(P)H-binding protein, partial [Terriglobales bacterium]|nr:NAD(P)H-binding protein [Terriglobales bacterium]